jgi:hypothetical protein
MFENHKKHPVSRKIYLRNLSKCEEEGKTPVKTAKERALGSPQQHGFVKNDGKIKVRAEILSEINVFHTRSEWRMIE